MAKKIGAWALNKDSFATLTDEHIAGMAGRGIGMAVLQTRSLNQAGGHSFSPDLNDPRIDGSFEWLVQKAARDSNIVARLAAHGIDLYIGFYAVNHARTAPTVIQPWADDTAWDTLAVPDLEALAGWAAAIGAKGMAFDGENYQRDPLWMYPGSVDPTLAEARARHRGRQMMQALCDGFGAPLHLLAYFWNFPGSYEEAARRTMTGQGATNYENELPKDFWRGATEATGWRRIDFWQSFFYKTTNYRSGVQFQHTPSENTMHAVTVEERERFYAYWRTRTDEVTVGKLGVGGFTWIPPGPSTGPFDDTKDPEFVREQLLAARDDGTTEHIGVYINGGRHTDPFDWAPYEPVMREVTADPDPDPDPDPEPDCSAVEAERDQAITERDAAVAQLAEVETERDQLRGALTNYQIAWRTLQQLDAE